MVVRQAMDPGVADRVLGALADPTRRDIVGRVLDHPSSVTALAERYAMSFAAVQRHVAVLERAGLVTKEAHGRERLVRGEVAPLRAVADLLDRYEEIWRHRVERMADLLTGTGPHEPPSPRSPRPADPNTPEETP